MIPFNKPYLSGSELAYIKEAVENGKISGDGLFTNRCHRVLETLLGGGKALLTTSCTDALEMAALLARITPGDEVILPSFTFVSTANAFALRGARLRFVDSQAEHPNIDHRLVEELVTPRTRVIVPVHYAGVSCAMDEILTLANQHGLAVIEDAAQSINSFYKGRPLGTLGAMGAFSFHETKNIISGEGGSLHINDASLIKRAEIIREKGTNRASFFRGEVDKYGWVDVGSSFLPSELTAAFLFAQLESIDRIQARRHQIWNIYHQHLAPLAENGFLRVPIIPEYATNNAHMYYLVCDSLQTRTDLIRHLKTNGVMAVFHYQSLHSSPFFAAQHDGRQLPHSDRYADCLIRLPLFYELALDHAERICELIAQFFQTNKHIPE